MKNNDNLQLNRRQAGIINRNNRRLSGNINALLDQINLSTYGISRTDKISTLSDEFNKLLNSEIDSINRHSNGDTTSFITKLFSENNKKIISSMRDLEDVFNVNDGELEAVLNDRYRNRLLKQADLHEVASQLVELKRAITITTDSIVSADIVTGRMSRILTVENDNIKQDDGDYISIIENIEKKFKLQEKIKNFIIPKSLEFGEYFIYVIPYSKIFEDFSKEKNSMGKYTESYCNGTTLYEFVNNSESKGKEIFTSITESVIENNADNITASNYDTKKQIKEELNIYLKNITVNNNPVPLCILEEGVESYKKYYDTFFEKTVTEDKKGKSVTFDNVMKDLDKGLHIINNKQKNTNKKENFSNIKDCYIKLYDPMRLIPIEILDEVIGYYYIQEENISPLSGILTSTVYYDNYKNSNENSILNTIAETIVSSFDKKFLEKNIKFKKLIVEALNFYKLNNKKIKFQFIPKEYIIPFKINEDENGHGVSIIENSLFYAKLYLMVLLFKVMSILMYSNDTKVNYIRSSGIEKNVANKIQEIARMKQARQITLSDMFSYTTLINKIGQGNEMYLPVGKSNERGMETEILSGQDVQLNSDLLEMLKKGYIAGTEVPDVLMNYMNEADFAKTLEVANNIYQARVISCQLDYNPQITYLYRKVAEYSTNIPIEVINSLEFNFIQPKYSNSTITNDLLNNHTTLQDFLLILYFGQDGVDDPKNAKSIAEFKKELAKDRLTMLQFNEIDEIFKRSMVIGTGDNLNPNNNTNDDSSM